MSQIGLERIELMFQSWPSEFKRRYKRALSKEELITSIENRAKELEALEIKRKFDAYDSEDLMMAKKYLDEHKIDHILTEVAKPKYKVTSENISRPSSQAELEERYDYAETQKGLLMESLTGINIKPNVEAEESKAKISQKSKKK